MTKDNKDLSEKELQEILDQEAADWIASDDFCEEFGDYVFEAGEDSFDEGFDDDDEEDKEDE